MVRVLSEPEAQRFIIGLLESHGKMTTREIEEKARRDGKRCPDETVLFLAKLKSRGVIRGALSQKERGWVWWV